MVKNFYDYNIDRNVAYALYKYGDNIESQRKLKWVVEREEFLGRILPVKTFRYHIKKMIEGGYIYEEQMNCSKSCKPLRLSSSTREQIILGNLIILYNVTEDRKKRLLASYAKLKKWHKSKEERLKIELKRKKIYYLITGAMSRSNGNYKYPGLSVTDIINECYYGDQFMYFPLGKERSLVEECVKNLQNDNIVRPVANIGNGEEYRYEFVDVILRQFVNDCSELFRIVELRSHLSWQNLMLPTPQERLNHESQWGKSYANRHINAIAETYKTNRDKLSRQSKKNRRSKKELLTKNEYNVNKYINLDRQQKMEVQISSIDYGLYTGLQELKKKYHELIDRHNDICNNIIETLYPKDLQIQIETNIRNPKNKDKKYFEIKRGYVTDALIFSDYVLGHAHGIK